MSTAAKLSALIGQVQTRLSALPPLLIIKLGRAVLDRDARWKLAAGFVWCATNLPAAIVMIRHLAGGPTRWLSSFGTCLLGFFFAATAVTAASLWCWKEDPIANSRQTLWRKTWRTFLCTFPLAIVWDTSLRPQSPFAATVIISLLLLVGTVAWFGRWWDVFRLLPEFKPSLASRLKMAASPPAVAAPTPVNPVPVETNPHLAAADEEEELEEESEDEESDPVSQSQKRTLVDGQEVVEGVVLIRFQPGEKQVQSHIAFCPPLDQPPVVEHFLPDGIPARSKVAACYAYGLRIELRRSTDITEELEFPVHYRATQPETAGVAAPSPVELH